jgi:hypothetical protein
VSSYRASLASFIEFRSHGEVHNPAYDFNDAALPLRGASFFARLVETRLAA